MTIQYTTTNCSTSVRKHWIFLWLKKKKHCTSHLLHTHRHTQLHHTIQYCVIIWPQTALLKECTNKFLKWFSFQCATPKTICQRAKACILCRLYVMDRSLFSELRNPSAHISTEKAQILLSLSPLCLFATWMSTGLWSLIELGSRTMSLVLRTFNRTEGIGAIPRACISTH